jgi:hypothetical protein
MTMETSEDLVAELPDTPARGISPGGFLLFVLAPFLLAAGVIMVVSLADRSRGDPATGRTYTFEIPAGTAERMARGEPVDDVFLERMTARVGDTFVVENLDSVTHQMGPLVVRAGETASITFYEAGTYQGACSVGDHERVYIEVT